MNWKRRSGGASADAPLPMPRAIWQIVSGRGYTTKEKIENLVQPRLKDLAHPFSLDHMDRAVERLLSAFRNNEHVLLYGDYDLDGTPGLVLLRDGLSRLGFSRLSVFQPSRLRDGYGVHVSRIPEFKSEGVNLIVTVDVGITDIEAIKAASHLGIDVVVTDHHLPKEQLPEAFAIVNPNKGSCGSRLQHLCGAGVAFYLVLALRMEMLRLGLLKNDFNPKDLLDLFAIATITDMVPLVGENRVLVKHGLRQLSDTNRPGLKRLFQELGYSQKNLSSQDVAFRIAPKLNALTRLDEGVRALDVLMAGEDNARSLVEEALVVNRRRVQFQDKAKEISAALVNKHKNDSFVWIHSHEFHPGVISLVASDLMSRYSLPVFVGAEHGEGRIIGSARAPSDAYNLQEILKSAEAALTKFGGHQMAAGFEIAANRVEHMRDLLSDYFLNSPANRENIRTEIIYDSEVRIAELDRQFMSWYENLGPFGQQFEAPKLLLEKAQVRSVRKLKGSFLRYTLEADGHTIEAPWFTKPVEFSPGTQVDVLFEPQWNEFNGKRSIQALVQNMRAC